VVANAGIYTARFIVTTADKARHQYDFKVRTSDGAWKCVQGELRHLLKESRDPRFVTSIELASFK
jgi:NAD(P)-dependent dehydrogenase (short-subunit alcohol dehydrogenase family)